MTRWIIPVLMAFFGTDSSLSSQAAAKWEYGRLMTIYGVPMVWITGGGVTQIDSGGAVLDRTFKAHREILGGNRPRVDPNALTPATLLLKTLNLVGEDGWELVTVIGSPPTVPQVSSAPRDESDMEYFFKRL